MDLGYAGFTKCKGNLLFIKTSTAGRHRLASLGLYRFRSD